MIRNLLRKKQVWGKIQFKVFNKFNTLKISKNSKQKNYQEKENSRKNFSLIWGVLFSMILIDRKFKCEDQNMAKRLNKQVVNVDIYELNKTQFLQILANINEEGILIVFNKYQKDKNLSQFEKSLQEVYNKCKQLGIGKIYLVQRSDIRHLQTFQRWLKNQPIPSQQIKHENRNQNQQKNQYFYFTPQFPKGPFKVQSKQIFQQVSQVRTYSININPADINQQIFEPFKNIFNRTTVIKQCPEFIPATTENKCIEDFRKNITTLIEQSMLKNKSDQFRFFALTPKTKKDLSPLISFHQILKQTEKNQALTSEQSETKITETFKNENIYVLRNDLLGKQIKTMKDFKAQNYSMLKSLNSYEKFLLLIRPRIFIVSKSNPSVDLYWYVTCFRKNNKATISINNTDSFNLGRTFPITDGFSYPQNRDLQFLKELYKNHPQLNYLIVNTEIVSQLVRHLPTKNKYTIFNLTADLNYPKMFLPHYNNNISSQENYSIYFKPLIEKFISNPRIYDFIVLDKEKKINSQQLKQMNQKQNQFFLLRVCNMNCQQDLSDQKLQKAFQKLQKFKITQTKNEGLQKDNDFISNERGTNWKNRIFEKTYWIDSAFNNIGLDDGEYVHSNGQYESI